MKFAKALIFNGFKRFDAVNIIGFNAPEWNIAYLGSIFVQCIPVGIYTTNNVTACEYISQHSQAKLIVA
jgi:long-chain-fatty-acid--CoA ligase ACSBG